MSSDGRPLHTTPQPGRLEGVRDERRKRLARPRCHIPEGGALVETCTRIIQGRLLLRPDVDFDEIFLGVLGRALDYT